MKPSNSYEIALPFEAHEKYEDRVSSFWLEGNRLALQLSSYIRQEGEQITAAERLIRRMNNETRTWLQHEQGVHPDPNVDQASAEFTDDNGFSWIHSYIVWHHLTIYAIVSGPASEIVDKNNWALQALSSIRLVVH